MIPTQANLRTRVAWLCNDVGQTLYTNPVIDPAIEQAYFELQSEAQLSGISNTRIVTDTTTDQSLAIGATAIAASVPNPTIVFPLQVWSRNTGSTSELDWQPMTKVFEDLPFVPSQASPPLLWKWATFNSGGVQVPALRFVPCTVQRDIRIQYIQDYPVIGTQVNVIGCFVFITYRAGAIVSALIGKDEERAQLLNDGAQAELEKMIGINIHANQGIAVRRRPYTIKRRFGWITR